MTSRFSVISILRLLRTVGLVMACTCVGLTSAQGSSEGSDGFRQFEEVVVTAQKRTESLQDVPISMSVLGAEELTELNIFDFTETAKLTPGVNLFPGVQSAAIRLRGVGPAFFALTAPQSVAVFIDEIAQGSVGAAFSTLVDIERLELLRGPQGTLYGQNAPSGAYNITTRAPNTEELEGYVEATYGQQNSSDLESIDLRGAINLPLMEDALGLRIAGVYADSDGYVKVKNPASSDDSTGGKDHKALRSRLLWNINQDMDITWNVNYQDLTENPVDFNVEGIVPGTGGDNPVRAIHNRFEEAHYFGDFISEANTDLTDTSLHWRWYQDAVDLDVLASFQDFDTHLLDNRAPYPGFDDSFDIQLDWQTATAEIRLSKIGEKFDYLAGLYYADRDIDGALDLVLSGIDLKGPADGGANTKAVFANLTFHLSEKWDLTTGARYDKNEVWTKGDLKFSVFNSVVDDDTSFDHLSWSIKLRHYVNEDITAYIAVDNAFKQGGYNNLVPGLIALGPLLPDYIAEAGQKMLAFDEETSTAYEIGIKGTGLDGRFNYSLAFFYQEFDDHQITQPLNAVALNMPPLPDLNTLFLNQIVNADEVQTKGVEMELDYLLGDYWDLGWRLAYFDATIEDWQFRFCGVGEESSPDQLLCPEGNGEPLNSLPQWNSNFQLGHVRPLSATLNFYGRLSWSWRSSPNYTFVTDDFSDAKSQFDLSLGIQSLATGLDVKLWGKNLLDEDNIINPSIRPGYVDPSLPPPLNDRFFQGRSYGLTVAYNF